MSPSVSRSSPSTSTRSLAREPTGCSAYALKAEVDTYLKATEGERDEHGHALIVRNGYHNTRQVLCGAGSIEVRAPRVNDRRVDQTTGERKRFKSVILPPYMRRSPKVAEVLPLLYLHGLSTGDFAPALKENSREQEAGCRPRA